MRIAGQIPGKGFKVQVFTMNEKYIIKIEAGPMEQTFKLPMEEYAGLPALDELMDAAFMGTVKANFDRMWEAIQEAEDRHSR